MDRVSRFISQSPRALVGAVIALAITFWFTMGASALFAYQVLDGVPEAGFEAMVGYFMLHHLPELERYFRSAQRTLRPGGRMVFVEPNPFHPLYPVQIACTPGMRWQAERGIYQLTPKRLRRAAAAAGFSRVRIRRYGSMPRAPYNWLARLGCERMPEPLLPAAVKPFQAIMVER